MNDIFSMILSLLNRSLDEISMFLARRSENDSYQIDPRLRMHVTYQESTSGADFGSREDIFFVGEDTLVTLE